MGIHLRLSFSVAPAGPFRMSALWEKSTSVRPSRTQKLKVLRAQVLSFRHPSAPSLSLRFRGKTDSFEKVSCALSMRTKVHTCRWILAGASRNSSMRWFLLSQWLLLSYTVVLFPLLLLLNLYTPFRIYGILSIGRCSIHQDNWIVLNFFANLSLSPFISMELLVFWL